MMGEKDWEAVGNKQWGISSLEAGKAGARTKQAGGSRRKGRRRHYQGAALTSVRTYNNKHLTGA